MTFLLLTNAGAGSADRRRVDAVVRILESAGSVEIVMLDHATDLEQALDHRGDRRLIVAGGDGTLHRIVAALHRRGDLADTDLGLIPLGTGNDFARGAGVPSSRSRPPRPSSPERSSRWIWRWRRGDIAVNLVHLGVGAEASRRVRGGRSGWAGSGTRWGCCRPRLVRRSGQDPGGRRAGCRTESSV